MVQTAEIADDRRQSGDDNRLVEGSQQHGKQEPADHENKEELYHETFFQCYYKLWKNHRTGPCAAVMRSPSGDPSWRPLALTPAGEINPCSYTLCVVGRLRLAIRRREDCCPDAERGGDPGRLLLAKTAWRRHASAVRRSLNLPARRSAYLGAGCWSERSSPSSSPFGGATSTPGARRKSWARRYGGGIRLSA
jgi:hypothetical protein